MTEPHVLVIEQNQDLAEDIGELLGDLSIRATLVGALDDAEREAQARPFDVALVDLAGNGNGLALLPGLKTSSPDGEIIVMSGAATVHSAMEAVRLGVFAYLSKPFDPADLLRLVDRALGQVALRKERTSLSRDLARSDALHRAVLDTVDSLIIGVDPAGAIRLWNERAAVATGWSAAEATGQPVVEVLFRADDRDAIDALLRATLDHDRPDLRIPMQTRDGNERTVEWHFRPMTATGMSMVLLAGTDVTDQLELERRAADAEAMAAMGRLTSALAHEIRNPLNAARLQLELLRRRAGKAGDDSIVRRSGVVEHELKRLNSLLDDFLGLARPKHLALEGVDPVAVAARVFELEEPVAQEAGVELTLRVPDELAPIEADANRLTQALLNLVMNALDATTGRSDARVEIAVAQCDDGRISLSVTDNGPGLPTGHRVLEPFETTKEGGTGLGLPIVHRIAQMHGGTLELGAGPDDVGTQVEIRLPTDATKILRDRS